MTTETDRRYRDGSYLAANPTWFIEDAAWKAAQIDRMLRKHGLNPKTIYDVGCGAGHVLRSLAGLTDAAALTGYDISPDTAKWWTEIETDRLHFQCADFLAEITPPADLLLCLDVFEHVRDYIGFLQALRSRATHTIFHIPLDISVQSVARMTPILQNRTTFGHIHYFTTETALATLADAGYSVVDYFYTASGVERGETAGEKLARWPRRIAGVFSRRLAARFLGGYSLLVLAR